MHPSKDILHIIFNVLQLQMKINLYIPDDRNDRFQLHDLYSVDLFPKYVSHFCSLQSDGSLAPKFVSFYFDSFLCYPLLVEEHFRGHHLLYQFPMKSKMSII